MAFFALVFTKCFSHTDQITGCKSKDSYLGTTQEGRRRRSCVRLSKDPEGAQVHGTDEMHLWVW